MIITEKYLSINEYSRPGKLLKKVSAIILHWVGVPNQTANQVWNFFEDCKNNKHYSSAHYIIDFTGEIIKCIPDTEMAYHCGSNKIDPVSKKIYTDWAREKFGYFASSPNCSPNQVTVGIELCTIDNDGHFRDQTISSAIDLVADLLRKHKLTINDIGTHNKVVGWKDCPKLWVNKPMLFDAFVNDIKLRMENNE